MKKYDVIIIGAGPAGIVAGTTGKKQNPEKSFLMIKKEEKGLVPCGIPYVFHDLDEISQNAMGPKPFIAAGGEVLVDTVTEVNAETKNVKTESGKEFLYDKLVFATGSAPIVPKFIKGYDLEGVELIKKNYNYIEQLKQKTDSAKNIVVIGGGFIGAEVSEQLAKFPEKNVTLVEAGKHCLYRAFSSDICIQIDEELKSSGVNVFTEKKVEEILGENGQVKGVKLANNKIIPADIVISAVGYKPNVDLAKNTGLYINSQGAIRVDNYLRSSIKDVYAAGDAAGTVGFITGRTDNIMLASTGTAEARVLGYNLFTINLLRNFAGTLSVFSTELNHKVFASAGAIERSAKEANIDFVIGKFQDIDRHPGTLSGASKITVKLAVNPKNGEIIGGEICGGKSVGEMINVISLAIQKAVTVYEFISFQVGTHPLLTNAPTKYILIKAAENAVEKINKRNNNRIGD
ncbi:MAG: FAD-dependent oxidoreductase [Candidatus Cloacimonadota bacterium]|nr:FAD-dependent oxidoreductase [Candidatus Cloacimonadota bacterium]